MVFPDITPTPILRQQLGVLQFSSISTLTTWNSHRPYRLRVQSHKTAPLLQTPAANANPDYPPFRPADYNFIRSNHLLDNSHNSRKRYIYGYGLFIRKDTNEQTGDEAHMVLSVGSSLPMELGCDSLQRLNVSTWKLSQPSLVHIFLSRFHFTDMIS